MVTVFAATAAAKETDLPTADRETLSPAQEAVGQVRAHFELLRLEETDFRLSAGWELPFTIKSVEDFFVKPLDIPVAAGDWADRVENAMDLTGLFDTALAILGLTHTSFPPPNGTLESPLPAELKKPVAILLSAIKDATPRLERAVNSVTPQARAGLLTLNEWPDADTGAVRQEISAHRIKQRYENMKSFSEQDLAAAGRIVMVGVDRALAALPKDTPLKKQIRWKTIYGDVLLRGRGDDVYEKDDLKGVAVLIDIGGNNVYKTPVAVAHEKEIRIAIDLGANVRIDGEDAQHGNAGAGIFGIAVLALPNAEGVKEIKTGHFSQGFGMGGVGVLLVQGTAHLSAQRMVQGAGVFGVGILSAKSAKNSTYVATRSGQGSALTRGIGLFLHEGDNADIKGGLVQPDPREPLGSVSMCQGVGFGPRAYAGGGVGIAVIKGNGISVKGSYFSQGVGYWHGFGAFRLRGDNNTLQARRYDMGSGIHSAFGHMDIFGNKNRILNWGVGPSYGWDRGIGSSLVRGNENEMQTDWGAGTASIGSLSFSLIQGDRNKLKLCDFGTNNFFRDEPAYSIQLVEGLDNKLQCLGEAETNGLRLRRMRTPWGLFQMQGASLEEDLGLTPAMWPELPHEEEIEREMIDLGTRIKEAAAKPPLEEVSDLVDVAAAFSVEKSLPRQALQELLLLPPEKAAVLIDILEPAAIDQLVYLGVAVPAHGDSTSRPALALLKGNAAIQKKAVLINFLRMARPTTAAPALLDLLKGPLPEELRVNILRTMAALLNQNTGAEPGARAGFAAVLKNLEKPNRKHKQGAVGLLEKMRLGEAFGLLASAGDLHPEDRTEFLENGPDDVTSTLGTKGAQSFLKILAQARRKHAKNVKEQLRMLEKLEPEARQHLAELLASTRPASVNAAVIGLGQIANAEDAPLLEPFLRNGNARVRESAAVALARMGTAGLPFLQRAQKSSSERERCLALVAVTQSVSPKLLALIEDGLKDNDPMVRLTAATIINNLPESLQSHRERLVQRAKKGLRSEQDPDVRLALELL